MLEKAQVLMHAQDMLALHVNIINIPPQVAL